MTNHVLRLNKASHLWVTPRGSPTRPRHPNLDHVTTGGAGELEQSPLGIAKQTQIPKIYMQICTHTHASRLHTYIFSLYSSIHEIPFLYSLIYL